MKKRLRQTQNVLWVTVARGENLPPVRLVFKKTTLNRTRLQLVTAEEYSTVCWCNNIILPSENVSQINLDCTHSLQNSIFERYCSGEILSKPKIMEPKVKQKGIWTNLDQELSFTLRTNLKGLIRQQISFLQNYVRRLLWVSWPSNIKEKKGKTIKSTKIKWAWHHSLTCASEMCTLYEWVLTTIFTNTSESKCL